MTSSSFPEKSRDWNQTKNSLNSTLQQKKDPTTELRSPTASQLDVPLHQLLWSRPNPCNVPWSCVAQWLHHSWDSLWGSLKFGWYQLMGEASKLNFKVIRLTSEGETKITWKEWNKGETTAAWKIPKTSKRQKLNGWSLPSVGYQYSVMTASDLLVGLLTPSHA